MVMEGFVFVFDVDYVDGFDFDVEQLFNCSFYIGFGGFV